MAEITQSIPTVDAPNFLGYSRGVDRPQPDRSFEAILNGVQNTVGLAVQGTDQIIKKDITDSLYAGIDPIRDSQGVGQAVNDVSTPGNLFPNQAVPQTVKNGVDNVGKLQAAYDAGKINETTYWARIEALSRQLRTRYPGYREFIDQSTAGITGSVPANALRRSILSDVEQANNKAAAAANKQDMFIRQNLEWMTPETRQKVLSNQPYDFNKVVMEVGEKQAYAKDIEIKRAEISYAKDSNNLNAEMASSGYTREANTVADTMISNFQSVLKANNIDITKLGEGGSPEQETAVRNFFAQARVAMSEQLNGVANSPLTPDSPNTWSTVVNDPNKIKNIQQQAVSRLDALETAYFNKDYGALNAHANYASAAKNADIARLLSSNDAVRRLTVASDLLGPNGLALVQNSTNILSEGAKAVATMSFVNLATVDTSLVKELSDAKAGGVTDPKALNGIIDNAISVLSSPTSDIRAKGAIAANLFGPKNIGSLDKFQPNERMAIFTRLASPQVTKSMNDLKDSYPIAWEGYVNWTLNSFGGLFKQETSDLQNTVVYDKGVKVAFDPKALRFSANLTPEGRREQERTGITRDPNRDTALVKINSGLTAIKPILQANGQNAGEIISATLAELGVDTNAAKQNTFGEKVFNAVSEVTKQMGDNVSSVAPSRTAIDAFIEGWNRPAQGSNTAPTVFNDIWGNASSMPPSR